MTIDGATTKAEVQSALETAAGAYLKSLVAGNFTQNLDAELDVIAPAKQATRMRWRNYRLFTPVCVVVIIIFCLISTQQFAVVYLISHGTIK